MKSVLQAHAEEVGGLASHYKPCRLYRNGIIVWYEEMEEIWELATCIHVLQALDVSVNETAMVDASSTGTGVQVGLYCD